MQLKFRIESAPRNFRSRNDRLTHEAQSERRQQHGPRPRSPRGQEPQTCPCRGANGSQPNRKSTQVTAGNHEPKAKEERGSYRRNPDAARRGIVLGGAQGANPRRLSDVILDRSWRQQLNGTPERFSFGSSVRLGIAHLNQPPSTSANLPCSPGSANVERFRTGGTAKPENQRQYGAMNVPHDESHACDACAALLHAILETGVAETSDFQGDRMNVRKNARLTPCGRANHRRKMP